MTKVEKATKATLPLLAVFALGISACSGGGDDATESSAAASATSAAANTTSSAVEHDHHAHHSDGDGDTSDMTPAVDPEYPVGSTVTLTADHMPGMDGSEATITGAFTTDVYAVSYDPTDGGPRVEDHKWVVAEELENPSATPLQVGDTATIATDHMPGMEGAEATIDEVLSNTTVYMVDTADMKNHKWVIGDEIE